MAFMVLVPVFVPYLQGFGLSMSQILQTQALFALTIALCEVPSGYIADIWGRRKALVLGTLLNALGYLWLLSADSFIDILVYELILGVGLSLASGADLALLYDSKLWLEKSGESSPEGNSNKTISRLVSIDAGAMALAGVLASVLMIWSLRWVVLVQAVVGLLPFVLALSLVEPPRITHDSEGRGARRVLELLIFGKPVVLWVSIAIILFGLLALYAFWIYQKYWEVQGVAPEYFGYIWAVYGLVVSLSARYSGMVEQRLGARYLLILIAALPLLGLAGMALFPGWLGIICGLAIQASRGLSLAVFYDALNSRVSSEYRATINSLVSLGVRGVFIVTGPALGYLVDTQGVQFTLWVLVLLFAPVAVWVIHVLTDRVGCERREESQVEQQRAV